jgi:hypothetical protein
VHKEMIIEPGEFLIFTGNLWDYDDLSPNDLLGTPELRIPYDAIGNVTYDLLFDGSSNGVAQADMQ